MKVERDVYNHTNIIKKIEEFHNKEIEIENKKFDASGIRIILEDNSILYFCIDNYQQCCESSGYITTLDSKDFDNLIGATLYNIEYIGTDLKKYEVEFNTLKQLDSVLSECMFINIYTSEGKFQFVAYNSHNGYYGHDVLYCTGRENFFHEIDCI